MFTLSNIGRDTQTSFSLFYFFKRLGRYWLDTINLCKLLRLGELKPVWCPKKMGKRRLLYQQLKAYRRLSKMLTTNKNQLQASQRH